MQSVVDVRRLRLLRRVDAPLERARRGGVRAATFESSGINDARLLRAVQGIPAAHLGSVPLARTALAVQRAYGNRAARSLLGSRRRNRLSGSVVTLPAARVQRCGDVSGGSCPCHSDRSGSEASAGIARLLQREDAPAAGGVTGTTGATETTAVEEAKKEEEKKEECPLVTYTGTNFTGDTIKADTEFKDSLDTIDKHAGDAKVAVHVTDSFRVHGEKVEGAIVPPASRSNHLAGHAIDMNVKYGDKKDTWCNSTCLKKKDEHPSGVKEFIKAIQDDAGLRWGGDFSDVDPVHIDDHLNSDTDAYDKRFKAVQEAKC